MHADSQKKRSRNLGPTTPIPPPPSAHRKQYMDASALLLKQGWRGTGHSLDHTDRGIKRPLLVSKKVDVLGLGVNKHAAVSDQWWLRAYDQGLQTLGTGQETALSQAQKHGVNRGGLYGRFVKGEGIGSTFGSAESSGAEGGKVLEGKVLAEKIVPLVKARSKEASDSEGESSNDSDSQSDNDSDGDSDMVNAGEKRKRGAEDGGEKRARTRRKVELSEKDKKKYLAKHPEMDAESVNAKIARRELKLEKQAAKRQQKKEARAARKAASVKAHQAGLKSNAEIKKKRRAEKKATEEMLAEYAAKGGVGAEAVTSVQGPDGFAGGADVIGLDGAVKQTSVAKPETEQDKIDRYRATKHGLSTEEYRKQLAAGKISPPTVDTSTLGPQKLASYKERAAAKGVSLEDYIRRRDDKYAAKQAEKLPAPELTATSAFVIDIKGNTTTPATTTPTLTADKIPLDPKLWAGKDVKTLPKPIRAARRAYMAAQREQKAAIKRGGLDRKASKPRGQAKVEAQEKAVLELLQKSREAGPTAGGKTELQNGQVVPLVRLERSEGAYSKGEMSLARRAVRRVTRAEKRRKKRENKAAKRDAKNKSKARKAKVARAA